MVARVPEYQTSGRLNVGGAFSLPNTPAAPTLDTKARALQGFGQSIESFGANVGQIAERQQASADDAWFSKARAQTAVDWQRRQIELEQSATAEGAAPTPGYDGYIPGGTNAPPATPGAAPYVDNVAKEFQTYRDSVLKGAPTERARDAYTKWSDGFGAERQQQAIVFEENAKLAKRSDDFNSAMLGHAQVVAADPSQYDVAWARVLDDFAAAKEWMTPEQEVEALRKVKETLQLARAKRLVQTDPLKFQEEVGLATGPVATTAAKIIGVESRGNPTAANPKSSASGLGQFTDGTWVETVRKHRPDLAALSDKELIALKGNSDLGREMTIRHTEDNASALSALGHEATEANLYLAHFAGIGGAQRVLGSPDDTPIVDVLGADVVRRNPFLAGKNVGWLKQWTAAKMAGTAPAAGPSFADNPYYSDLTPDQVFALAHDADSAIVTQHNAAVTTKKAIEAEKFNTLMTNILDGRAGLLEVTEARTEGWLHDYDAIKKATDAIATRDKDAISLAKALALEADPAHQFNPFVNDDKNAVDLVYKSRGGATELTAGDTNAAGLLRATVTRTGIVPESAVTALRLGMISRKQNEMAHTFAVMDGLYRQDPGAMIRAFTEDDIKRLQDYQALAPVTPPDELYARLDPNTSPQARKLREELAEEGRKLAHEIPTADLLNAFEEGHGFIDAMTLGATTTEPVGPIDPLGQVQFRKDFEALYAERYAVSGNAEVAKTQAIERLRMKWGVSEVGDAVRLMSYPPERYYPAVDDSHDWMADDLAEFVDQEFPGAQSYGLVVAPETEAVVSAGGYPGYWVGVFDQNGAYRVLSGNDGKPALVRFDYEKARGEALERFEEERRKRLAPTPAERDAAVPFGAIEEGVTDMLGEVLKPGTGPEFDEFSDPDNPMGRRFDR